MKFRHYVLLSGMLLSPAAWALCPWNTSLDSGLGFCTDANNAFGPFTRAMTTECTARGGGPACTGLVNVYYNGTSTTGTAVGVQRWGKDFARSIRGTADCPRGATRSSSFDNRCVETTSANGTEVYGPFPQNWIDTCRSAAIGGGNACFLMRWSATVYNSVKSRVGPAWRLPMPNGYTTSDWCVCRNIGTSPHIGWDLVNNGAMTSVAVEAGRITSGPTLNGSCGWELELTDRYGTRWFYRHLNRPSLSNGQSVAAGATIGLHRDYPGSGCGSGAHLHIERLNAGYFGDSAVSKNCTGVLRSCNFDPRRPFPSFRSTSGLLVFSDVQDSVVAEPDPQTIARQRACRVNPADYAVVDAADMEGREDRALQAQSVSAPVDGDYPASRVGFTVAFADNPANQCATGVRCVIAWEAYAELQDGSWRRLFADATVRNQPVEMHLEAAYCAPAAASGRYRLKVTDQSLQDYRIELHPAAPGAKGSR